MALISGYPGAEACPLGYWTHTHAYNMGPAPKIDSQEFNVYLFLSHSTCTHIMYTLMYSLINTQRLKTVLLSVDTG